MAQYGEGEKPISDGEYQGTQGLSEGSALHLGADMTADTYFEQIGKSANTSLSAGLGEPEMSGISDIHGKPSRSANSVKMPQGMQDV